MPGLLSNRTFGCLPLCALDGATPALVSLFCFASGWIRVCSELVRAERRSGWRIDPSDPHRICRAGPHHRSSLPGTGNDESPDAGVVGAAARIGDSLSAVRVIEPGIAAGAGTLSDTDRTEIDARSTTNCMVLRICSFRSDHRRARVEGADGDGAPDHAECHSRGRGRNCLRCRRRSCFGSCCQWGRRCS